MVGVTYRQASENDFPAMAEIRSADWGTPDYWQRRILQYLRPELPLKEASLSRVSFVAVTDQELIALIAGHLTNRFGCEGELQWISVHSTYRGRGIGSRLLYHLADWFADHGARRICVDVEPGNIGARRFYARHGAHDLRPSWMVWSDILEAVRPPLEE